MNSGWKSFFQRMVITTLAVFIAEKIVLGVSAQSFQGLLAASLLLGILNAFLRPVMLLLSLPLLVVTFGLFTFVINALLLYFVGVLLRPDYFVVTNFWAAFKAGIVITLVSLAANLMIGKKQSKAPVPPPASPSPGTPPAPRGDIGSGPVIDI
jgi:putative membrane protein